jgi:hypothetical protein
LTDSQGFHFPSGRFDLFESAFKCKSCDLIYPAAVEDYIASGYFPGSPKRTNFFISADLSEFWFHLKFLTPGTSEQKFLETLSAVSFKAGRVRLIKYHIVLLRFKTENYSFLYSRML